MFCWLIKMNYENLDKNEVPLEMNLDHFGRGRVSEDDGYLSRIANLSYHIPSSLAKGLGLIVGAGSFYEGLSEYLSNSGVGISSVVGVAAGVAFYATGNVVERWRNELDREKSEKRIMSAVKEGYNEFIFVVKENVAIVSSYARMEDNREEIRKRELEVLEKEKEIVRRERELRGREIRLG